jgi:hypothetical protein
MDSGRASALKLLRGLLTSREVLRPSEPYLSLYSTKIEFGSPLGGAKPHFVHTFCQGEHGGIYRRIKSVPWLKLGLRRPTCQAGRPLNLAGRPILWQHHLSHIGYPSCRLKLTRVEDGFRKDSKPWPAGQRGVAGRPSCGLVQSELCATSSLHVILSVNTPGFGHN